MESIPPTSEDRNSDTLYVDVIDPKPNCFTIFIAIMSIKLNLLQL